MRVLMVTKFVPLPDNDGGKQRALAVAVRLAHVADVVLCAYDDGDGDVAGLKRLGIDVRSVPWRPTPVRAGLGVLRTRSVSAGRFYSAELVDEVRRAAQESPVDVLQVEYLQMVPVARQVAATRKVLDLHNVESALVRSYAHIGRGPKGLVAHAEAAALGAMERSLMPSFDTVVVVSERERRRLPAGLGDVLVCPNGKDPDPSGPLPPRPPPRLPSSPPWAGPPTSTPRCGSGRRCGRRCTAAPPGPASCSSGATRPPRSGPLHPHRWRFPVPFQTSARTLPRREWR